MYISLYSYIFVGIESFVLHMDFMENLLAPYSEEF